MGFWKSYCSLDRKEHLPFPFAPTLAENAEHAHQMPEGRQARL